VTWGLKFKPHPIRPAVYQKNDQLESNHGP
jgi:hypothetical protein